MTSQPRDSNDLLLEIIVEPARIEDAEEIRRIQAATWLETYPNAERGITYDGVRKRTEGADREKVFAKIEFWREHIETVGKDHAVFVARRNSQIIGYVAPGTIDEQSRLGSLYVLPEAQGLGAGKKLLQQALDWLGDAVDVYLHVAVYNTKAIDFYKRFGFEMTGRYFDDEDGRSLGAVIPEYEMVRRAKPTD